MFLLRATAIFLGLVIALTGEAAGQLRPTISSVDLIRIRLKLPSEYDSATTWVSGRVATLTADSVSLWENVASSSRQRAFAAPDIEQVEVAIPRTSTQGAMRGALVGPLVLGVVGAFVGLVVLDGGDEQLGEGAQMMFAGGAGVIVGLPLGALLGAALPGTRWIPAELPRAAP